MADWLPGGRETARRLAALEHEIRQSRTQASSDASRTDALIADLSTLAGRLAGVTEERLEGLAQAMVELEARLGRLEDIARQGTVEAAAEKARRNHEELTVVRTAITRAERQLEHYAEESRKMGAGLWERIETLRKSGSAVTPLADIEARKI